MTSELDLTALDLVSIASHPPCQSLSTEALVSDPHTPETEACYGCAHPDATSADIPAGSDIGLCTAHFNHWVALFGPPEPQYTPPCAAHLILKTEAK